MLRRLKQMFEPKRPEVTIEEHGLGDVTVRAGGEEVRVTLPYPDWSNVKAPPRPPITLLSPACPYCGVIQDPPPQRRKKCRDCGETIHTWTDQEIREKVLLTASEYKLRQQEAQDAEWSELNRRIFDASRSGDWHTVKMSHFRQALMLFDQGRDHQRLAAESRKSELRYYQTTHRRLEVQRIVIETQGEACCSECRPLHEHEYSIDEALEAMPIPVKTCQTWADKNPHGGWCRCYYNPVIPL